MTLTVPKEQLPRHVAIIMDGNGRWAQRRGLPRSAGHKEGARAFRRVCDYGVDIGLECMTFYAFSTENWNRPSAEVEAIMNLFRDYLREAEAREAENIEKGIRARYIGERAGMPADILELVEQVERRSAQRKRTTVNLAINYGGRNEILQAVRTLAQECAEGRREAAGIQLEDISAHLYTAGQPDPDLIIRPSGENRLSNFLIWQSAYAEFWTSDVLWPDFTTEDLDRALADYAQRNRRFGGIS